MALVLDGNGSMTVGNGDITGLATGALPANVIGAGAVVQVVRSNYTTLTATTNTGTWTNIGSATITPQSASNRILITATYHVSGIGAMRLLRNSTTLNSPNSTYMTYSYNANLVQGGYNSNSDRHILSMQHYDSPATTSSTTYNVEMIAYSIAATTGIGVNEIHSGVTFSGITLMEISA